jgi:hypothetical protein
MQFWQAKYFLEYFRKGIILYFEAFFISYIDFHVKNVKNGPSER